MDRRDVLRMTTLGGLGTLPFLMGGAPGGAALPAAQPGKAEPPKIPAKLTPLKITDVKTILTAPARIRLVIVKVMTSEPGLYGVGCATFTQRARVVETAIDRFLKPFLIGKDPTQIEDVWQSSFVSSYWRNGPVLNNAISGVDVALWDILGKRAGLPLYQLLGGKCRNAVDVYRHASGRTMKDVEEACRRYLAEGYRHIRVQVAIPGQSTYGAGGGGKGEKKGGGPGNARTETWEPGPYVRTVPKLFEYLRKQLGDDVELLHDVHERVPPILGMRLVKDLEQYRPFFIEDPFSPEDIGYFTHLRQQTTCPLAMGELFNSPHEWLPLVSGRLIDFIRIHVSQIGGLTMARKIAAMCEFFAVRTAWHGPGDTSPVGHAAQVHLDLVTHNFGIQEARDFSTAEQEVFPGCPTLKDGYYHVTDKPGLGIDVDEKAAAKFPPTDDPPFDMSWGNVRRRDGTIVKP